MKVGDAGMMRLWTYIIGYFGFHLNPPYILMMNIDLYYCPEVYGKCWNDQMMIYMKIINYVVKLCCTYIYVRIHEKSVVSSIFIFPFGENNSSVIE